MLSARSKRNSPRPAKTPSQGAPNTRAALTDPGRRPQDRKRLEAALRASEDRYRSLFEHDLTGDFIARPDGTLLVCNPAFAAIFGFASPKEALAPPACKLARLLPDPDSWPKLMRLLKRHKCVTRRACDWVRLDGTPLRIVQTLVGKFNPPTVKGRGRGGELVEVQGYLFDDTKRTRAAAELARSRSRIEDLVKERTKDLEAAHLRLHLSDRLASIGTLAAGLGHDMNNVLLPVRARLNVLRAACGGGTGLQSRVPDTGQETRATRPSLRPHIEAIAKSVAYLQQLADGLHYLAQDPENTQPDDAATDLRRWWSQTGVIIAKAVPRHVKLTASFPGGAALPPVSVAPHRLTQAVLNLVVNAGEAIPPLAADPRRKRRQGRVRVWAEAHQDRDGRAWVRLGVTDNGVGMTPEVKRRAFELFFTTKTRGHGTGLGLPLVYKVATRVGGAVEIDSKLGKGTTVTMKLPAAGSSAPAVSANAGTDARASLRAVVTIADGRIAAMARHVLEAAGCEVATADAPGDVQVWVADARAAKRGGTKSRKRSGARAMRGPVIIEDAADFETIRAAIAQALIHR
ncbi:two-component system, NtrC family, sensor kinase [Phycisphaerales bacterium]|nr:two-component system, NtrC family, sensor kinase [Phycisphaerales bacterium]